MRVLVALLVGLLAVPVQAADVVWRSSTSGVLPMSTASVPPVVPPVVPSPGFAFSMSGGQAVAIAGILELVPVVAGHTGSVSYRIVGRLPIGATFNRAAGRISGRALVSGEYPVRVIATDSTGVSVVTSLVLRVG